MKLPGRPFALASIAAVAATIAGSANAQTQFSINYDTAYTGYVSVAGAIGPEDVYLTAFQASYVSGAPLPFPTPNPFNTFCVDISPNLVTPGWWTAENFPPDSDNGNTLPYVAGGIERASSIYNHYVGNVDISTASGELWGAALQVAIWSDLYGSAFQLTGADPSVTTLEDSILGSPYNVVNPNLTSTFWNATNPSYNQDLIGPMATVATGFVPEPGTYATVASACGLLAFAGIRRKRA